jgi:ABC-2 type transport system permease protein
MHKTWLVFKNELVTTLTRKSYLFTLFGLPIIAGLIMGVIGMLNRNQPGQVDQFFSPPAESQPAGLVDYSGIVTAIPEGLKFIQYTDESLARQDLADGKLADLYLIDAGYMENGKVTIVREEFNPIASISNTGDLDRLMSSNLLKNDPTIVRFYENPVNLDKVNLNPNPQEAQDSAESMLVPTAVIVLFYILLIGSSSQLLNSVTHEKENRVIEILMSSLDARQVLTGKILALGVVGLIQMVVWVGGGMLLMGTGRQMQMFQISYQLKPELFIWGLIFFLGGYFFYASLMAGVGALAPNMREGSQVTSMIIMPMIIPMILMSSLIQDPNGTLAVILSLVPLTSSITMIARLSAGTVPFWQVALAAVLLIGSAIWVLRMVAAMFRSQVILAGQPISRKRFFRVLIGKLD